MSLKLITPHNIHEYSWAECFIFSLLHIYKRDEGKIISYQDAKNIINEEIRKIDLEKEIKFDLGILTYGQIIDYNKLILLEYLSNKSDFIFSGILKDEESRVELGFYLTQCLSYKYTKNKSNHINGIKRFLVIAD